MTKTRVLLVLFGLALSAAAIVMLGRSIDVGEAMRAMGRASIPWFLAANLLTIAVYWLRSLRWRSLLKPHASPTVGRLFRANMVGFLAINILPARLGELVRAFALARKERISTAAVLGSVAVERILDLVFLGIFWALSLLFAPLPPWFKWSGYATIAIAVVVGGGIWFLNAARGRSSRLRSGVMAWVPHRMKDRFSASVSAFGEGIQIVGRPALLLEAAFWSAASWLVSCGTFLLVGQSLG
ncbi:MAG TPA: lysylphosphatidylglycerol synthase transmembrane domain-containing protein, partial [Candidatus Eisenbacteria bacterium]|nr:lysylphosphatidylglycerol synthase transmembrane domain-containing protein [Candidatus Eisenbacteria bacterium]